MDSGEVVGVVMEHEPPPLSIPLNGFLVSWFFVVAPAVAHSFNSIERIPTGTMDFSLNTWYHVAFNSIERILERWRGYFRDWYEAFNSIERIPPMILCYELHYRLIFQFH